MVRQNFSSHRGALQEAAFRCSRYSAQWLFWMEEHYPIKCFGTVQVVAIVKMIHTQARRITQIKAQSLSAAAVLVSVLFDEMSMEQLKS